MSRKILSIDIRDHGIVALLVENSLKGNRIADQRFIAYADLVLEKENPERDTLSLALSAALKDMPLAGVEPIVTISAEFISYRNLQVPFKDRKKIRQVLPFEMEPTLPYPVDEVSFDFETILQGEKTDILVGIVNSAKIREIMGTLREIGIDPHMICPAGFSSALCLCKYLAPAKEFIFIDLDDTYATIFTVKSGEVYTARAFYAPISDPAQKVGKLRDQITQVVAAFESLFALEFDPETIFLSGKKDPDNLLAGGLSESLSVPVSFVDIRSAVHSRLPVESEGHLDPSQTNNALALAVADITGLRTLNFTGERSILKKYWEEYKNELIRTGLLLSFVFVLVMFNTLFEAHFLQKEVNRINRQIAFIFQSTFPEAEKIIDPLGQMKARLAQEREKNAFSGDMAAEILNIDILNEISSRIPAEQDVELSSFVRGDSSLVISGDTDSFNTVDDIKTRLETAAVFKAITISSANLDKSTNRIQFKLKIDL